MTLPLRVLLVDEETDERSLAETVLATHLASATFDGVGDESVFHHSLRVGAFDLVVTELETAWARGGFLLKLIREHQPDARIVVFTHVDDRQEAVTAMKAGAADYLVKSPRGYLDLGRSASSLVAELARTRGVPRHESAIPPEAEPSGRDEMPSGATGGGWGADSSAAALAGGLLDDQLRDVLTSLREPVGPMSRQPVVRAPVAPVAPEVPMNLEAPAEPAAEPPELAPAPGPVEVEEAPAANDDGTTPFGELPASRAVEQESWEPSMDDDEPDEGFGPRPVLIAVLVLALLAAAYMFLGRSPKDRVDDGPAVAAVEQTVPAADPAAEFVASDEATIGEGGIGEGAEAPASVEADRPAASAVIDLPSAPTEAPIHLVLRANDEVWVMVSLDGEAVWEAVMVEGQEREFNSQETASLLVGNAGGLSVSWNGQDLGNLGEDGQVRRLSFSRADEATG